MEHVDLIKAEMTEKSPSGITGSIGRLVRSERLEPGTRLPTVRALASALDLNPTTVAEAWSMLRDAGIISTEGRRGTFVRDCRVESNRFWRVSVGSERGGRDLSTGTPDPELLPSLCDAFGMLQGSAGTTSYFDPPVLEALEVEIRNRLPFDPERVTIVNGAMDALDRIISLGVGVGGRVVVEDPTFAPILDLLDRVGADVIGVPLDERGLMPAALSEALESRPDLVIVQPRAQNPTGTSWDADRYEQLVSVLEGSGALVVEDDHSADVAGAPLHSLASHLHGRVVHIRSFSKAYGPDLRLAAVTGPADVIDSLVSRRQIGPAWSSRLLQKVLHHLLTDEGSQRMIADASKTYAERRGAVQRVLRDSGIEIADGHGFNIWLPVESEQRALVTLAANGISAAPGSSFHVEGGSTEHIRLTVSTVTEGLDELGSSLAEAASSGGEVGVRA